MDTYLKTYFMNVPQIEVIIPPQDLLIAIIKAAHHYYPIGFQMPLSNEEYPGYQELIDIIRQKITQLQSNNLPTHVRQLEKELADVIPEAIVRNELYRQFPNYQFALEIASEKWGGLEHNVRLILIISLLTKHYTVFFDEWLLMPNNENPPFSHKLFGSRVLSFKENMLANQDDYLQRIQALMAKFFPGYTFVPHSYLFAQKVKYGVPYGETDDRGAYDIAYPVFHFLFDNQYNLNGRLTVRP